MKQFRSLPQCVALACLLSFVLQLMADPLDTVYWKNFYINMIGVGDDIPNYQQAMLSNTGGIMPRNVKVGFGPAVQGLGRAKGGYYDYLPTVNAYAEGLEDGRQTDMTLGTHLNAMPWSDLANQSVDILQNYLEIYGGGILLQKDRNGLIRSAGIEQDPTINETDDWFSFLEMQLTLSPYAPLVQDYMFRNTRLAARYFAWLREEAPDIITFCTLTSEPGQNIRNGQFCDYSDWSIQEFRDWLSGAGLYAGEGQYDSLSEFNTAFSGADNFPWSGWNVVVPPTNVQFNTSTPNGNWWYKWHEFRIAQVQHFEQEQMTAAREAGWSPDRLFGHQQAGTPDDLSNLLYTMKATPWTTTFVNDGGNGVTCGGANASNTTMFTSLAADDKSWALVEYNPNSTNFNDNVYALGTVWDAQPHVICPYQWSVDRPIKDTVYQTALEQFIGNHSNDVYSGMAKYETAPESRSILWSMSYSSDIESSSGFSSLTMSTGVCYAVLNQDSASISLDIDDPRHTIVSDGYYAMSARMFFSNAPTDDLIFQWTDTNNAVRSVSVPVEQGWNLCRVNLDAIGWRQRNIKALDLTVNGGAGNQIQLDWLKLEAGPCWHFDDPSEVSSVLNFNNWSVTNGQFTGTSGADGYFYLTLDGDRTFIDADRYKQVRIRLTSDGNRSGQLYWWNDEGGPYYKNFYIFPGTYTYRIDLTSETNWTGRTTRLRFDPVNAADTTCSVGYITFSPLLLPPRAPVYDTIVNSSNPRIAWESATEPSATLAGYDLQVATDFDFSSPLINTSLTDPVYTYIGQELDGLYWWRVRSCDTAGNVSPWMVPMPLFVRVWNADSADDFVSLHSLSNAVVTNGIWTAETGADPYFDLNTGWLDSEETFDADTYKQLQIRLKVNAAGTNEKAQVFYFSLDGDISAVTFSVPPDDEWHDCIIDLSSEADWIGMMKRVRIDPTIYSGATVSVDRVTFLPASDGDFDGDGIADNIEGFDDPDGDGLENFRDLDSDGDSMSDFDEAAAGRDPYTAADLAFHFNTDGDFEGWTNLIHLTDGVVSNGIFSALATTGDPYLYTTACAFNSEQIPTIYYKLRGETNGYAVLYWKHDGGTTWNVKAVNYTNAPDWQVCQFDVNSSADWTGTIDHMRVDPSVVANQTFAYDWIVGSDDDLDGDGISDAIDGLVDADGDGLENFRDTDSDDDGVLDAVEGTSDSDSDGLADYLDTDSDDDGIKDGDEASSDLDGDGVVNRLDSDSDGDGMDDGAEAAAGRDPYNASDLAFWFDTDDDREGWLNAGNVSSLNVSNGTLNGVTTTGDPMLVRNSFDLLNTADISNVYVRLKSTEGGTSQFFWRDSAMNYHAMNSTYAESNEWQVLSYNVASQAAWTGSVSVLRIDPINKSGATFEIDWILASDGDFDGDGIADSIEGSADPDGDGLENFRDLDSDGDGFADADEAAAGRDPYTASDLAFHFNTDGDFEGWTNLIHLADAVVSNGILSACATTSDPYLYTTACAFNSEQIQTIHYKLCGETNGYAVLYWKHDGGTTWDVKVVNYTNAPDWQICQFNVNDSADWTGTIDHLRVDPSVAAGQAFAYDWILASGGDLDGDGISDSVEGTDDFDGDGLENFRDPDSDGDSASDADEILFGSDPYDAGSFAFHFETDDCFEGWTNFANIQNSSVSNGVLSGLSTNNDPYMYNTNGVVDSDGVTNIYVKLSAEQSSPTYFYWKYQGAFRWAFAGYTNTGNPQVLTFNVGSDTNWAGLINYLRVDPSNISNTVFAIDWIISSDGDLDDDGIPDSQESKEDHDDDELEDFRDWDSNGDGIPDGQ